MEIIHWGTDPDNIKMLGECGHCGTRVRVDKSEAFWYSSLGMRDSCFLVECPVCRRDIVLEEEKLKNPCKECGKHEGASLLKGYCMECFACHGGAELKEEK